MAAGLNQPSSACKTGGTQKWSRKVIRPSLKIKDEMGVEGAAPLGGGRGASIHSLGRPCFHTWWGWGDGGEEGGQEDSVDGMGQRELSQPGACLEDISSIPRTHIKGQAWWRVQSLKCWGSTNRRIPEPLTYSKSYLTGSRPVGDRVSENKMSTLLHL